MKKLPIHFLLLLITSVVFGQKAPEATTLELYLKKQFNYQGNVLPYRILYPDHYDKHTMYPLLLFLHGAGLRGNDNEQQLMHGARLFLTGENQKKYPTIVVIPQCPANLSWSFPNIDKSTQPMKLTFDYTKPATWPLKAANELVRGISDTASVDKSRIYITGFSMGGMGTFESVFRYPDLYAAALPICGAGDAIAYDKGLKNTSFWIFHGANDSRVDVKHSREMAARLKKLKIPVKYTEYAGVDHNSWDNAFADPNYLEWMFMQKRKEE
jgi:predicted peptidase